jgi:hypothetical protein
MKRTSTRKAASSSGLQRELARLDRELFGAGRSVNRNDQYFHLWQRILLRLAEAIESRRQDTELARLEKLASQLERAQRTRRLPTGLVRELIRGQARKETRRGTPLDATP